MVYECSKVISVGKVDTKLIKKNIYAVLITNIQRYVAKILIKGMLAVITIFGSDADMNSAITPSGIYLNTSLISGVYDYHSSVNFDAYLTELGVPWYLRNLAAIAAPSVTVSKDVSGCQRYEVSHHFLRNQKNDDII